MDAEQINGQPLRDIVIWNKQQINGNGGKGLLSRMNTAESDIENLKDQKLDRYHYDKQRYEDLQHNDDDIQLVRKDIRQLREDIKSDKRLTVAIIGVGMSTLFSAASLIIAVGGIG